MQTILSVIARYEINKDIFEGKGARDIKLRKESGIEEMEH